MRVFVGFCIALVCGTGALRAWSAPTPSAQTRDAGASARVRPVPSVAPSEATQAKLAELPIDFRCDNMVIKTEPNRNVCQGRVVLRRGNMVVCCNAFEGVADARWQWQRFVCTGDVRASRDVETAWADKAEFFVADNDLVLTGKPVLHRGDSMLEGERVTMNIQEDYARVVRPRGRMHPSEPAPLGRSPVPMPTGALPAICPIPALGRR